MSEGNNFILNFNKNIKVSLLAQVLSNLTSLLVLVLGMFYLDPNIYVGIQIILAYMAFAGFSHIGIVDGLELRIAGNSLKNNTSENHKTFLGTYFVFIFTISCFPLFVYLLVNYKQFNINIFLSFITYPILNINALFLAVLRSYGFSWIGSLGLIIEKVGTIFFIVPTIMVN